MKALPHEGKHVRRKGGELVIHTWDSLPAVAQRRAAVVVAGRAFQRALDAYRPEAVYPDDRDRVNLLLAGMTKLQYNRERWMRHALPPHHATLEAPC